MAKISSSFHKASAAKDRRVRRWKRDVAYGSSIMLEDEYRKAAREEVDAAYDQQLQARADSPSAEWYMLRPRNKQDHYLDCLLSLAGAKRKRDLKKLFQQPLADDCQLWEECFVEGSTGYGNDLSYDGFALERRLNLDELDSAAVAFKSRSATGPRGLFVAQRQASVFFPDKKASENWVHEPEGILSRLEGKAAYPDDYEAAVLFAEVAPFRGDHKARLLKALRDFISERRFVDEQRSIVTLCSAIRKFAMNMQESDFEGYGDWLLPTETAVLHHEAEMEFAKGICWRLKYESHKWPACYPTLTKTLFELVDAYIVPRLILQNSYANTAMFGIVAVHVLEAASAGGGKLVSKIHEKVAAAGVRWFAEMVSDNIDEAINRISERDVALAKAVARLRKG